MTEKNPSGPPDAMPHVIEKIIRTMHLGERFVHLDRGSDWTEAYVPETETQPPTVRFRQLAHKVVQDGLFQPHPRLSDDDRTGALMPQELLDIPYPNGPAHIMLGGDVPVKAMEAVRGGIARANRIVLKPALVGAYFHQRFANEQPLLSPGIIGKLQSFNAAYFCTPDTAAPPDDISFLVDGVNRTTHTRNLFTGAERLEAIDLAAKRPEIVAALSAYQGTIIDYLCELGVALANETNEGNLDLSQAELALFSNYINEWRTDNFFHELLPAIAIFLHNARAREPGVHDDDLMTAELLHEAVGFIIRNGAFKKHVAVPAHVAADETERTNEFACPAANIIREHLVDGRLLYQIYHYLKEQSIDGNSLVLSVTNDIREEARRDHSPWLTHLHPMDFTPQ